MIQHLSAHHASVCSDLNVRISEINRELSHVVGFSTSIRNIGQSLPATPHESDDALCPELIFPALASNILHHANNSLLLLEKISGLLCEDSNNQVDGRAEPPSKKGSAA